MENEKNYDAWLEGYQNALRNSAHYFSKENSIKWKIVGNWIVSAKILGGCNTVICIYNKETKMEHYQTSTLGPCSDDASEDVKAFYDRAFEHDFERVCKMAKSWN